MEKRVYSKAHQICAWLLGVGGMYWAMMLVATIIFPPLGAAVNLAFFPGWIAFLGWWYIALRNSVNISTRLFWIYSATVNAIYLFIHLELWKSQPSFSRITDTSSIWWVAVFLISLACAIMKPARDPHSQLDQNN